MFVLSLPHAEQPEDRCEEVQVVQQVKDTIVMVLYTFS